MTLGTRRNSFWLGSTGGIWAGLVWLLGLWSVSSAALAGHFAQQFNGAPPWPEGKVYYSFDPSVTNRLQGPYLDAIREWELAGKVKFVPRTNEGHYIILNFNPGVPGSSLTLGNVPVLTVNTLARWELCHQLGHSLGLAHENYRTDRDTYITILTNNLQPGAILGLAVILPGGVTNGPYDFESVMHPTRLDGSIVPGILDSIRANAPYERYQFRMGGRTALSVGDRAAIAALYGAAPILSPVVTSTADGGVGSLRAAIYYANDHPGSRITFNIPTNDVGYTNGAFWIRPSGQIPTVTASGTEIDGTTQPGFAGQPVVVLDGSGAVPEAGGIAGLEFVAANCVVRGLNIQQFSGGGMGFLFADSTNNRVEGCYVGTGPQGTNNAPNVGVGISMVQGAAYNIIGGTNVAQRNIISGNISAGIVIRGTNTVGNRIIGNFIGLDATGTQRLTNSQTAVQIIDGASSNIVGGASAELRNYISGNDGSGVLIAGTTAGNLVQGNYIGLDITGTNGVSNVGTGVAISEQGTGNVVGGTAPGAGNLVGANLTYGIAIAGTGAVNNYVQGNWIGLDATGNSAIPNGNGVILLAGANENWIGGTEPGARNVISGNQSSGIAMDGTNTSHNAVLGNLIGTDPQGRVAIPNRAAGVLIHGSASGNKIGSFNFISGNQGSGVSIEDPYTTGNSVFGNIIGVGVDYTNILGNSGAGVAIVGGAVGNYVGGTFIGAGNVIAGNRSYGLAIAGSDTSGNTAQGNWLGLDGLGKSSGNGGGGVAIFLGTHDNLIGGSVTGAGNTISGNYSSGIVFDGTNTMNNTVQGNRIGTDLTGRLAVPNQGEGIDIRNGAGAALIGGTTPGAGNLISGNTGSGIVVSFSQATGVMIQGNTIGSDVSGTEDLKNSVVGVWFKLGAHDNVVGLDHAGTGVGNVIAYSQGGVVVDGDTSTGNTIRGNTMPHNSGAAIYFLSDTLKGNPPHTNDVLDLDIGPNNVQNYPVLTAVDISNNVATVSGQFNSTPNHSFVLDFYRNVATNGATYGDADAYVGSITVTTGSDGNAAPFVFQTPAATDLDRFTATATDLSTGDTSELSPMAVRLLVPLISGPLRYNTTNGMHLSFNVNIGQSYRIQVSTNLATPSWVDVQTVNADVSGLRTFDLKSTNDFEFYRLVSP